MNIDNRNSQEQTQIHYTVNIAVPDRKIFFVSDIPHLIKTTRNCLLSFGFSSNSTRILLNGDKYLLWSHIAQAYHKDLEFGRHRLLKIGPGHINVSPFGKMRVSYAVQILSKTMSYALSHYFPEGEADDTAKFCTLVNDFFDINNIRSRTERTRKRNDNLELFKSLNDPRLGSSPVEPKNTNSFATRLYNCIKCSTKIVIGTLSLSNSSPMYLHTSYSHTS